MKTLPAYWDSFYVKESVNDKDANVYAPELVNTTYCLGVGYNTKKSVQIVTKDTDTVKVNKVTYEMWDTKTISTTRRLPASSIIPTTTKQYSLATATERCPPTHASADLTTMATRR